MQGSTTYRFLAILLADLRSCVFGCIRFVKGFFCSWIRVVPRPFEVSFVFSLVHKNVLDKPPPISQGPIILLNCIEKQGDPDDMRHSQRGNPDAAIARHCLSEVSFLSESRHGLSNHGCLFRKSRCAIMHAHREYLLEGLRRAQLDVNVRLAGA